MKFEAALENILDENLKHQNIKTIECNEVRVDVALTVGLWPWVSWISSTRNTRKFSWSSSRNAINKWERTIIPRTTKIVVAHCDLVTVFFVANGFIIMPNVVKYCVFCNFRQRQREAAAVEGIMQFKIRYLSESDIGFYLNFNCSQEILWILKYNRKDVQCSSQEPSLPICFCMCNRTCWQPEYALCTYLHMHIIEQWTVYTWPYNIPFLSITLISDHYVCYLCAWPEYSRIVFGKL